MKEYICKEDMMVAITDSISECQGNFGAIKRQHEIIDEMDGIPTITKADIIDECIKEILKLDSDADYGLLYPHTVCNVLEMLKEKDE